jgi:hypothetical protein
VAVLEIANLQRNIIFNNIEWIRVPVPQEARVTPSVRAASVRWMPVSGPSTSEAWTGIDEKIQRPQSKELANNFLNFIKCPPFTF